MKVGLFILSTIGFILTAFVLAAELPGAYTNEHIIYLFMLGVLLCNCAIGILMNYPHTLLVKKKIKLAPGRYAIKK